MCRETEIGTIEDTHHPCHDGFRRDGEKLGVRKLVRGLVRGLELDNGAACIRRK